VLLLKQLDFALVKSVYFYSTTLAQDAPDITSPGYEHDTTNNHCYIGVTSDYVLSHATGAAL